MRRATPALLALLLVTSALAAVPAATMAQETSTQTEQRSENATVAPGAQLAGAVGVQGAELGGEVEARAYGISVAKANTDNARAAVVAEETGELEVRLEALRQRKAALQQARENGSMSEGEYRARTAQLHAETRTVERLATQTNETASTLPAEALEAEGVDMAAVRSLADRSEELTGPEVAEIARSIAGNDVGEGVGPAADRGSEARENRGERNETGADAEATVTVDAKTNDTDTTVNTTADTTVKAETGDLPDANTTTNETVPAPDGGY
ncbi:hypothetical protein NDI85_14200 [Halomicroarcula sp. S1AR25-4]|uniref:hypothetical protein n=1 Tax=Haloarcula sp. S1AR25-4 TaxID=2950538 RepID=UPI0028767968|nr:hypothetical protein [Halomicroarcula sp. S1AR25-4]MDS0278949.1 hypothetical protein [Halomicroarcula sp. S1AR25-4]